jgi:hypothetical protein
MKRSQRKGNISPRWEWLRSWCSEIIEVWVGVWVEAVEIFGATRFEWWAWVDLNHRPRPYQSSTVRSYNNLQDRGDCQNTRKSYNTSQFVGWIVGWKKSMNSWSGPIDLYLPSDVKSIQVNFRTDGHARAQLLQVPLIWMKAYPHWESLYDLHVVARGILGRK